MNITFSTTGDSTNHPFDRPPISAWAGVLVLIFPGDHPEIIKIQLQN